jgi:uncharacterized protein with LGFP repeats
VAFSVALLIGSPIALAQVYSSPAGSYDVHGAILAEYQSLGGPASFLGSPLTNEIAVRGGAVNHFQGGSIYWSPATGAHAVKGAIRDRWASLGWENGYLGFPTTGEVPVRGGAVTHFQGGSIYWSPATGAQAVKGAIRDRWASLGWENGFLGFPTTGEVAVRGGAVTHFQGGSIYWSPATGAQAVKGAIRDRWASLGWENGYLGFPTTGEVAVRGGAVTHFQGGSIYWSPANGAHAVKGAIRDRWASLGWENSALGFPRTDEYSIPGGAAQDFACGSIRWTPGTGAVVVGCGTPPSDPVYYANCTEVWNAIGRPLLSSDPGYETPRLDRDGDGVACETDPR